MGGKGSWNIVRDSFAIAPSFLTPVVGELTRVVTELTPSQLFLFSFFFSIELNDVSVEKSCFPPLFVNNNNK